MVNLRRGQATGLLKAVVEDAITSCFEEWWRSILSRQGGWRKNTGSEKIWGMEVSLG